MKKNLASVFSFILSLFLAFSLLAGSLCLFLYHTALDEKDLIRTADESKYGEELYEEITDSWENLFAITGVSQPKPMLKVLTEKSVEDDAFSYLRSSFEGKGKIDTAELEKALDEKLREYVKAQGEEEISEEVEKNIRDLVSSCKTKYEKGIRVPMLPTVLGKAGAVRKYLPTASIAAFVFALALAVFIFFLQKKKKETLYFLAISAATCGIVFLGAAFFAEGYELTSRLPLEDSALLTLMASFLQFLIDEILLMGIAFFGAAVLILVLYLIFTFLLKEKDSENTVPAVADEKEQTDS